MSNIEQILSKCDNCKLNECDGCITCSDMQVIKARIKELEEENMEKDLEKIGIQQDTEANMKEIIEKYYTANEKCIPKQREKEMQAKIKELEAKLEFKKYGDLDEIEFEEYMSHFIPKQKVKDVLQNNRNEIFSFTYVDDEQFKPYTMQIDRINKIEKELLEEGE